MEIDRGFDAAIFWYMVEYAGMLLRESDLDDIAHYFVYVADDWAKAYLA